MDISKFNVDKKNIAKVVTEQTFWIGENADVEVMVNLYEHEGEYKLTSWLNGTEELNTESYEGDIDNAEEILAAMEKLVNDNEDYILDVASWDGE
jgi:IMP cyclohydrolase